MKILALEFSSSRRSVAVAESDSNDRARILASAQEEGRETRPLGMIETCLVQSRWSRADVDCIAVAIGPGSYTGIRVAISIAHGWQLAWGVKLLGISSVECLAAQAQGQGIKDQMNIAIDAQRDEFYLASGNANLDARSFRESLRLVAAEEVEHFIAAGQRVAGPDLDKRFPKAQQLYPEASALAKLAAARTDFVRGEQLEPIYLRPVEFVKAPPPRIVS
jgi:tRNA threonylcarbamoyl adenosine modification protein YeaZ